MVHTRKWTHFPSPHKWYSRRSVHKNHTYEQFRKGLYINHALNEKEYIHDIIETRKLEGTSDGKVEIWQSTYNMPALINNRTFVSVIYIFENTEIPEFYVVSRPALHPLSKIVKGAVRGYYESVERVKKLENGEIEWIMATTSDAGGYIPTFLSELAMPSKISEDVPAFLSWLDKGEGKI